MTRVRLVVSPELAKRVAVICRRCGAPVGIVKQEHVADAMKVHMAACSRWTLAEEQAERARIDEVAPKGSA